MINAYVDGQLVLGHVPVKITHKKHLWDKLYSRGAVLYMKGGCGKEVDEC